ncbi:hypothetical protein chiPu_0003275 [Chiloscyllium punctatum]|uniref:Translation elongation factor EF1B beta/delta subunit guanine nucleotide exchange domain-containing protein n=1 Tax=Chiloscyllium punctatum TaxID=137246 RepID=A0A401S3C9_CHIPU|nr:hypothetical protein [Chiloscyllium punctatum]
MKAPRLAFQQPLSKYGPQNLADTTSAKAVDDDDNNDIDLFEPVSFCTSLIIIGNKEERLAQYETKKSKKPALIAKLSILLDVKPWDGETDMVKLEECVRSVTMDGLLWGASKLVPVGYSIKKL